MFPQVRDGGKVQAEAGFNPSGFGNSIPVDEQWRAFYKVVLTGGLGSEVGIGRSMTKWRTLDVNRRDLYLSQRMTEPPPPGTVRQAGDVSMLPITGGPFDLPTTWWTATGDLPSSPLVTNPSYSISMGTQAQVHLLQECVGLDTIRIWAAFVDSVDINLQCDFVELFPYAEFDISECGSYVANFPAIGNRKVFSYQPPDRVKPFQESEPLFTLELFDPQYKKLFTQDVVS